MNWVRLSLLILLTLSLLGANITYSASGDQVEAILAKMTPEEKVGQLFLITFSGSDVSPDSPVGRLIGQWPWNPNPSPLPNPEPAIFGSKLHLHPPLHRDRPRRGLFPTALGFHPCAKLYGHRGHMG